MTVSKFTWQGAWDLVVGVPVTSCWIDPDYVQPSDRSITDPEPQIAQWMNRLKDGERLDLIGRACTQALLGEPVVVVSQRDEWTEVRLPLQPGPVGSDYVAWIPTAHLTEPSATPDEWSVLSHRLVVATPYSRNDHRVVVLSAGSLVEVVEHRPDETIIRTPYGVMVTARPSTYRDSDTSQPALAPAQAFLGLPYVWAGLSGFGVDCSGLVHLAHRVAGLVVPRDVEEQSAAGCRVDPSDAQPGDIVTFHRRGDRRRHHVGITIGPAGWMLHAPRTGKVVEVLRWDDPHYRGESIEHWRFMP